MQAANGGGSLHQHAGVSAHSTFQPCYQPCYQTYYLEKPRGRSLTRASERTQNGPVKKVVGLGSCGLDYLASVARFPHPDEKMRTDKLETQGGGNVGNALTALTRLGLSASIISKIGDDAIGDGIISEFKADGVDTSHLLRHPRSPSPFTYIIVDRAGGTRTCIHTPGQPFLPDELTDERMDAALAGAHFVYFDGRLAEAALKLARHARRLGIQVLVEAERLRPGLEALLAEADYVVTSEHFPQDFTGEPVLGDALLATALRLPHAKFVITTMGVHGSVLLERPTQPPRTPSHQHVPAQPQDSRVVPSAASSAAGGPRVEGAEGGVFSEGVTVGTAASAVAAAAVAVSAAATALRPLSAIMEALQRELAPAAAAAAAAPPVCTSPTGVAVRAGAVVQTDSHVAIGFSPGRSAASAAEAALTAASRAAALNADPRNAAAYAAAAAAAGDSLLLHVVLASVAHLPQGAVEDTTGAGDSFIGTVLYGLAAGLDRRSMLRLAAVVAASKCTALGARQGLPLAADIASELLYP